LFTVPPETTIVMSDLTVAEGQSVVLTCGYYGDPVPTVTWFKGEKLLFMACLAEYHHIHVCTDLFTISDQIV
jgi:hypothetical protein